MGDWASIKAEGIVREELRAPLSAFFDRDTLDDWDQEFVQALNGDVCVAHFVHLDRASQVLFGALQTVEDAEFNEADMDRRNIVNDDGTLLVLASTKNLQTMMYFVKHIIPIIFTSYKLVVTELQ